MTTSPAAQPPRTPRAVGALTPAALDALAGEIAARPGTAVERMSALRAEVLARAEGRLPASAAEAYAGALVAVARGPRPAEGANGVVGAIGLRASLDAHDHASARLGRSIDVAKKDVRTLDVELDRLSTDNRARFDASRAAFQAIRDQLAKVLTDRRRHEHDRVGAFFQIHAKNQQEQELVATFGRYEKKQAELRELLATLRADEAALVAGSAPRAEGSAPAVGHAPRAEGSAPAVGHAPRADAAALDGADLALFALARRTQQLERVLANLDAQRTLLRELVARAAGTNHALTGVATALDRELAECKAWVAATERDSAAQVIAYALGLAGFVAEVASMPAAAAAVSIARVLSSALLDDVDGARTEAEALVWRTVARLATAGLVDAGVGEGLARTLVASVRGVATAALDGERREARALADAAIRAGLGEAQRSVVSFLVAEASDALPLVSLVRSVLAMPTLTRQDAATLIDHLRAPGRAAVASPSGLDAALATLRAATE